MSEPCYGYNHTTIGGCESGAIAQIGINCHWLGKAPSSNARKIKPSGPVHSWISLIVDHQSLTHLSSEPDQVLIIASVRGRYGVGTLVRNHKVRSEVCVTASAWRGV